MKDENGLLRAEKLYAENKDKRNFEGLYQNGFKRAFDICVGLIASPFVLLISVPVAIAIKMEDGGPVFYKARRLGKGFKEFRMLKFRSMKVNAPMIVNADGSTFNSKNDPRVTKVGHFLRETSLDELPQVFNILAGHMSIIGPRPGESSNRDTYKDDEKDKLLVRPGITGYCQAYFRNAAGVREKRLYDAVYAHTVSLALDVKIFFKTIETVFRHENLYTND